MPENVPADAHLAFLYAAGEMDAAQAAAFERRLGDEQGLRDELCRAVELMRMMEGLTPAAPRPAYRDRVRRRLKPAGWWHRLTQPRPYRGHPALWSGLGAAAALLAVLLASPTWRASAPERTTPMPAAERTAPAEVEPIADGADEPATIEMAETWAHLLNSDHLVRARDEENRRRDRRLAHVPGSNSTVRH